MPRVAGGIEDIKCSGASERTAMMIPRYFTRSFNQATQATRVVRSG